MTRKFTSCLVLAALMLAIPIHAQTNARKQTFSVQTAIQKTFTLANSQAAKVTMDKAAVAKVVGTAFREANAESKNVKSIIRSVQKDKASFEELMASNFCSVKLGKSSELSDKGGVSSRYLPLIPYTSSVKKNSRRAEAIDDHGVITSPAEGVSKMYTRAGKMYYYNSTVNKLRTADQEGKTEIVETTDGTVYIKDILSGVAANTWVKGTRVGNTITIPANQMIYFWEDYGVGLYVARSTYNNTFVPAAGNITFTVNGDVITLNDTDVETPIAGFYTNDTFANYGDYATVLTYDPTFVIPDLVQLPDGANVETWYNNGKTIAESAISRYEQTTAKVAFVGNDVYLSGIFTNFPGSWIKGTINGTTVTFAGDQFVGIYSSFLVYAFGSNGYSSSSELQDFQMTYDAAAKTLTSVNYLLANASEDEVYFVEGYQDILISKNEPVFEEPVAETGEKVDAIPYVNELNTAALFGEFGVIDSNDDGKTWGFKASETYYTYSAAHAANDWLVSPAIKLEAGKKYRFAIDAAAASVQYPERLEVKAGAEPKASAMTLQVLEPTNITWVTPQTLENVSFSVAETGYYHFGIHAISDANQFDLVVGNFVVESGVEPTAPAAVTDLTVVPTGNKLEANISFTAPTKTVGGDNLPSLTKIEILRNGEVIKTLDENIVPGNQYSYVDNDPSLVAGTYTYQVVAYNASGNGMKSNEVSVFLMMVLDIPYMVDFTHEGSYDQFQKIDANNDGSSWAWNQEIGAYYTFNSINAADDYLVSQPIHLDAGMNYNLILTATAGRNNLPERFEVKLGKTATVDGLNTTIMPATMVTSTEEADFEQVFSVEESGDYYLAVHAISDADMHRLIINRIIVDKGTSPTAPSAITDFTVTPGAKGALEVNLAFTTPSTFVNGNPAEGTMDVDIYRDMKLITTLKDLPYGTPQTWKDTDVEDGVLYTYVLIPSNATGAGERSDHLGAYVGFDIPAALTGLTATDNGTSITFGWQKVGEVGTNGGYVDPTKVNYLICSLKVQETPAGSQLTLDKQLASVTDADSYELEMNTDEGDQDFKYWGVFPYNTLGAGEPMVASRIVGAAYTLPFGESFEGGSFHYLWTGSENAGMYISDDASDEDGSAAKMYVLDKPGVGYVNTGKLNLKDAFNPTLFFDVKSETLTKLSVMGSINGAKFTTVQADVPVTSEYTTVKVSLNSLKNGRYAQVAISADFAEATADTWGDVLLIDNIRIVDLFANDLSVMVEAPATVEAGLKGTIVATVKNEGENAATGYTIKVKAEDKELLNQTVNETLEPNQSKEFTAQLETSIVDFGAGVTITAEVVYESDQNPDNNVAETLISIDAPSVPAPTNVIATDKGADGVEVTWNAPGAEARAAEDVVTETFENGMGEFTTIDADGDGKNWNVNVGGQGIKTHSDFGSVFSQSYDTNAARALTPDNWLVTPLARLEGTFSFWACGQEPTSADEHFAVYVSTTTADDPAAFTLVSEEFVATSEMTQYSVDLSAYAGQTGYIAIRHFNTTNKLALVVDDVTFSRAIPVLVGFNIYYDREKIADVEGDKTTYTVAADKVTDGEHSFGVSAVYANGRESLITTAMITVGTDIRQIVSDGKPVDVYSLDGKLVRSQVKSLNGLKGVYVINGKTILVK
ncbi:Cleaved Adhesin Domain [Prevotellaceae bacterium MN60]|nr:Cleaved Adhesin Domain [Prevotellaceae bacterium MN60]